jgi:hypothetical protein
MNPLDPHQVSFYGASEFTQNSMKTLHNMDKFCYGEGVNIQISDFVSIVKFCEEN